MLMRWHNELLSAKERLRGKHDAAPQDGRQAMADEKIVVMERGKENRTLSWGVTPESKAYVRETSGGATSSR